MRGLSPVAASGGHSSSQCMGLSLSRPLSLRSTGSRCAGSVVVAHRPSCSAACGIFPDQGSNPCPLHWQADSQPLRHQGSPYSVIFVCRLLCIPLTRSSFTLVVSVVPQRLTVAASGILALQIRFPSPFPAYIYIFLFCSLCGPISHSQLLSLYFWMMLGENYKVCLAE